MTHYIGAGTSGGYGGRKDGCQSVHVSDVCKYSNGRTLLQQDPNPFLRQSPFGTPSKAHGGMHTGAASCASPPEPIFSMTQHEHSLRMKSRACKSIPRKLRRIWGKKGLQGEMLLFNLCAVITSVNTFLPCVAYHCITITHIHHLVSTMMAIKYFLHGHTLREHPQ